jgi:hypothetical protein
MSHSAANSTTAAGYQRYLTHASATSILFAWPY